MKSPGCAADKHPAAQCWACRQTNAEVRKSWAQAPASQPLENASSAFRRRMFNRQFQLNGNLTNMAFLFPLPANPVPSAAKNFGALCGFS